MNRILFAGTSSSSGKTTVSCGFMKALVERGQKVASFKCGPDYIDPMFHERVVGTRAGNLDGFFLKKEQLREMLLKNSAGCDIAVLEGVMGCYDGIGFTREASGYEVAAATGTPIVLIANARGMAASLVALVRGFIEEDRQGLIRGVILNQLPVGLFPAAKREIEAIRPGLTCYGYVPVNRALELKSRYLGLVTPDEVKDMEEKVALAARQIEETVDVEGLIRLAGESNRNFPKSSEETAGKDVIPHRESDRNFPKSSEETAGKDVIPHRESDRDLPKSGEETAARLVKSPGEVECDSSKTGEETADGSDGSQETTTESSAESARQTENIFRKPPKKPTIDPKRLTGENTAAIRIAVARDRAFSFLYRDNLNWLVAHGAEPVFFSPLEDEKMPENCQGLILPGGYPELYLEELEKNASMRASVRQAIAEGMPAIAECGGFLYLLDQVEEDALISKEDIRHSEAKMQNLREDGRRQEEDRSNPGERELTSPENTYSLAGVIHQTAKNAHRLGRFGYIYLTAQTDGLLADAGETIRAHEFHHYVTDDDGHGFRADKASGTGTWETGYHTKTLYAGFPHIYFPGNERAGRKFLNACAGYHDIEKRGKL